VQKEIAAFRELHPDRPILAAVTEGDPPHCFSPALLGNGIEPLAADLRSERDGRRLGLLKLVAGISGVSLDSLTQRDAQRRLRRVTAVTVISVVAMIAMGLLTMLAFSARAEAEHQRAEAEGLIEFMLTDLRDGLRGVGNLDVLNSVNGRALRYYGSQENWASQPTESLSRRARIFHAMGEDSLERNQVRPASAAFGEARRTTAHLVLRDSSNPRHLSEHARSLAGIGRVHGARRDWPQAERYFIDSAAFAERIRRIEPGSPEYLIRAAAAYTNLGDVYLHGKKKCGAAERLYERSLVFTAEMPGALRRSVHNGMIEANTRAALADTFFYRRSWARSLDNRLRQLSIMRGLYDRDPGNAEIIFRLAAAERGVAYSELMTGPPEQARRHLLSAHARMQRLVSIERDNADWKNLYEKLTRDLSRKMIDASMITKGKCVEI
jgi:hypothetical protein